MSNLRDYLEVLQLTKVADWLMEKQGVHNQIQEPLVYKYDKIDLEMITQWITDFKQGMIDAILMGNKKEMVMNKLELEIKELRERTGDNYMLNKMVNTDGVEFFAEYTLYKDYDKYFGLTLSGTSINIVDIMEAEFAELLSYYRKQPKDSWHITPEENETIKEQMESGETDKFTPVYDKNDIDKQLVVDSKYDMIENSFSGSYLKGPEMWTETSTNTGGVHAGMWDSSPSIEGQKDAEDNSKAAFISKVVADIMEELLTKGTCSINITLKQD